MRRPTACALSRRSHSLCDCNPLQILSFHQAKRRAAFSAGSFGEAVSGCRREDWDLTRPRRRAVRSFLPLDAEAIPATPSPEGHPGQELKFWVLSERVWWVCRITKRVRDFLRPGEGVKPPRETGAKEVISSTSA